MSSSLDKLRPLLANLPLPIVLLFLTPVFLLMSKFFQFIVLAAALAAYITRPPNVIKSYNRSLPYGEQREGEDIPRRHGRIREILTSLKGVATVPELFSKAVEEHAAKPCMGFRPLKATEKEKREVVVKGETVEKDFTLFLYEDYKFRKYSEIGDEVERFASGLINSGLQAKSKIAMFANTRAEWMIAAQAALSHNICVATVYASLGVDALRFSLVETEVTYVITEAELIPKVMEARQDARGINTIIYFDNLSEAKKREYSEQKVRLFSYQEIVDWGSLKQTVKFPPSPEDLAIIMYTSGTTGNPKGVMVTHRNVVSLVAAVSAIFDNELKPYITEDQRMIGYLPLAHILELAAEMVMLTRGYCIGYSNPRTLTDDTTYDVNRKPFGDVKALRPTFIVAVPIVLDKFKSGILAKVHKSGKIAETVFKIAYYMKRKDHLEGRKSPFWDALVFKKIQAAFGGNIQFILSGGAPLSQETQEFMNIVLGVPVLQGYGLTETCAGATICHPDDRTFGRVGPPLPCCEIKLVDVPEMNYTSRHTNDDGVPYPQGEVCIRGGCVTQGYYKNTEQTKAVFIEAKDGQGVWFHTGDIGMWHPDGTLEIIDRKKDLVKLKHGEYLALGHIESIYRQSRYVANICLHARSSRGAAVAVVVPNEDEVIKFAKLKGLSTTEPEVLYKDPAVKAEIRRSLDDVATRNRFHKFEYLGDIHLTPKLWTPENGALTDAMKVKRREVYDLHKDDLDTLYALLKDD